MVGSARDLRRGPGCRDGQRDRRSGSLLTFPTLVALGYSPLLANVSNNVGLVFGNVSGIHGYRKELKGQGSRIKALTPWSAAGGLLGATLLLIDHEAFKDVVPWLVLLAVVMVIVQPCLATALPAGRKPASTAASRFASACSSRASTAATSAPHRASS
jgi:uncharacterized protein